MSIFELYVLFPYLLCSLILSYPQIFEEFPLKKNVIFFFVDIRNYFLWTLLFLTYVEGPEINKNL